MGLGLDEKVGDDRGSPQVGAPCERLVQRGAALPTPLRLVHHVWVSTMIE